ncbi:hypothetical protein J7K50_06620 [bacterium]|nr:hypothetical protein [bacterium]
MPRLLLLFVVALICVFYSASVAPYAQEMPRFDGSCSVAVGPNDTPYFLCRDTVNCWIMEFAQGTAENIGEVENIELLRIGPDGAMYGIARNTSDLAKVLRVSPGGDYEVVCDQNDERITDNISARRNIVFSGLCIDREGNIYVGDSGNGWLIKVSVNGDVQRVVGIDPIFEGAGEGARIVEESKGLADGPGNSARLFNPSQLAAGPRGEIYISEGSNGIVRMYENGEVTTIAGAIGSDGQSRSGFRDGPAHNALFSYWLTGIVVDNDGNIFVIDQGNGCIRQITWNSDEGMYYVYTLAGSPKNKEIGMGGTGYDATDKDGTGFEASFDSAWFDLAVDSNKNLYMTKKTGFIVRKVTWMGLVSSFDVS